MRKLNYIRYITIAAISLIVGNKFSFCQTLSNDSIKKLPVVNIISKKSDVNITGIKNIKIDSLVLINYSNSSLSDILSEQSPVAIKSYSKSGLANVSIRGTSVNHTGIFWNGLNINTPNIGLTDISIIPSFLFNSIEIQKGGASSMLGSGIIGGSIHLSNKSNFEKQNMFATEYTFGSFGKSDINSRYSYSNSKISTVSAFTYNYSKNDFEFINRTIKEKPIEKQQHAQINNYSFMQDIAFNINNKNIISAAVWYTNADRQLPGTMTTGISKENETDENLRSMIMWKYFSEKINFNLRSAFFDDKIHYINPVAEINSKVHTISFVPCDFNLQYKFYKNSTFIFGNNTAISIAYIDAYKATKQQRRTGSFAGINFNINKINWVTSLIFRQEFIDEFNAPLTPSFGAEGKIYKNINAKFNVSKNFRVPTMNDRYWVPGGNVNLKPETSISYEASLIYVPSYKKTFSMEHCITYFHSNVDNWITWIPDLTGNYSPVNFLNVLSRGVEVESKTIFNINKFKVSLIAAYSYTLSQNLNNNNQLIYTPFNSAFATMILTYNKYNIIINSTFTGRRYVDEENKKYLIQYSLTNISFSRDFKLKNIDMKLKININNMFNEDYWLLAYQPMPGTNYAISLGLKIK